MQVSDDGLTYTVKLREEAKWSNGDPVTVADYVLVGNVQQILRLALSMLIF